MDGCVDGWMDKWVDRWRSKGVYSGGECQVCLNDKALVAKEELFLEREEVSFAFKLQSCQKVNLAVISAWSQPALESLASQLCHLVAPAGIPRGKRCLRQQQCLPGKGIQP